MLIEQITPGRLLGEKSRALAKRQELLGDIVKVSERVYAILLEEIVAGKLDSGAILAEVEQADRLGISRTPLREALHRLNEEGLVTTPSRRGASVTELSAKAVQDIYNVRFALEELAVRLAARENDFDTFDGLRKRFFEDSFLLTFEQDSVQSFYELNALLDDSIDRSSKNEYLGFTLRTLRKHSARVRRVAQNNLERLKASAAETEIICGAIASGEEELAARATGVHLRQSLEHVLRTFSLRKSAEVTK